MKPSEQLRAAKALIDCPDKWTTKVAAWDKAIALSEEDETP